MPDPGDPAIVYGTGLGGTITRFDSRTGSVQNISPAVESTYGRRPTGAGLRWTWIFPLVAARKPPHAIYTGAQYVLRSLDHGSRWERISPDLTGAEPGTPGCEGDVTVAKARPCGFGVIFTIALSPADENEIWVGTDDGLVQLTRDGGKTWKNVTPKGLPLWGKVATLDVSRLDPGVAYAAVDTHRLDDFTPHVYRTRDWGGSWQEIAQGLPASRFATVVRADPVRRGLLYAGTDAGVSISFDDGAHWQSLQLNLPTCWVGDLQVHGSDLVAATQGRALWVLDDVSPLRQVTAAAAAEPAQLLAPSAAVRVRGNVSRDTPLPPETPLGQNPPAGAILDYVLKEPARSAVRLEILDGPGEVVRSYSSDDPEEPPNAHRYFPESWVRHPAPPPVSPGHHRFVWDLRYPRPKSDRYEYSIAAVRGEDTPVEPRGPLAVPGRYTARLTVNGKRWEQPLVVTMDPRVSVAPEILASQLSFQRELVRAMDVSFSALGRVRALRAQLTKRIDQAGPSGPAASAIAEASREARRIEVGEGGARGSGGGLAGVSATLSAILVATDGSDTAPTATQSEGSATARKTLEDLLAGWRKLSGDGLSRLNGALRGAGIPEITIEEIEKGASPACPSTGGVEIE